MQVGQTIYGYHANNNRPYGRDKQRRYMDLPVGWERYTITGETKQSWIIRDRLKIDKKTMHERNKDHTPIRFIETLEEVERQDYVSNNWNIAEKVRYCRDYDKLKRIEAILGEEVL